MSPPLVSVIIPTHNRAHDLQRAIKSVLKQTYPHFELLIMDNGSTDNTAEVVEHLQDSRILYATEANSGSPARPRNRGIQAAQGTYVAFLDSDDWWKPKKLELSVKALESGADVVYHDLIVQPSLGWRRGRKIKSRTIVSPAYENLIEYGNAFPNSSVVVRRSLLQKVGWISESPDLIAAEDYEYWLRLAQVTEKFHRLSQAHGYYWSDGNTNLMNEKRTHTFLKALESLHFRAKDPNAPLPSWVHYWRACACSREKNFAEAKHLLSQVQLSKLPYSIALKALWRRLILSFLSP